MNVLLDRYAAGYAADEQKQSGRGDDQSSIHYPTVFLFIGDGAGEAMEPMIRSNELKWDNNAGVVYLHVAARAAERLGNSQIIRVVLDDLESAWDSRLTVRRELGEGFHANPKIRADLNRAMRQVSSTIADYGRMYVSFDRLHLAVITRADDPLNVLVPDIALLAQSILMQSFKSVQKDLYVLVNESEQSGSYELAGATGVSFLREVEYMQQPDFSYSAPLQVTGDGFAILVTHSASPLFDLVYLLSDRNEKGVTAIHGMQSNYAIICQILLLKNRKRKEGAANEGAPGYNNASFRNSLLADSGRQGLVSAGLASLTRPNYAIALTVLYHFTRQLIQRMKSVPEPDVREKLAFFGLDPASMTELLSAVVPPEEQVADMNALLTRSGVRYEQIRKMGLREAEDELFGDSCERFFAKNFQQEAEQRLIDLKPWELLSRTLIRKLESNPNISCFQIADWTNDQMTEKSQTGSIVQAVHARGRELDAELAQLRGELELARETRVEDVKFQRLPLMDKHNLRSFLRAFFELVYRKKLDILQAEVELAVYRRFSAELERVHEIYQRRVQRLLELQETFKEAALASIERIDHYTGQNVFDYYERVTEDVMKELEARRGASVFFEDRYVGRIEPLLEEDGHMLAERLIQVCRQHLLTTAPFSRTFEQELLERANVSIEYSNRKALSKEELFSRLLRTLDDNASINIRLLDYTHEHRYEERYLFGDSSSEFVRYTLRAGEASLSHKLGCVHENRSSGVDKLQLMGGFHIEDLLYYRNSKVYYETYLQNGGQFHSMDTGKLPPMS
ncbi:transcription initiation factor TFIID [Paenibacillus sp. GCM10012307]|uniref:Transcription initiation factor TFIID n=1 Tax=Paenibacillus roseus TaxID=2798579 RepID=A0A934J0A4_9BACL|nr:transcription initiation factor TFIID [Paenibacillus roseus]MBJ6360959.1 transcription initiation factor TFIID [Paenibacillus roseus]